MKWNSFAWLGIAGCFTGIAALISACGTSDNTINGGGDGVCGNAVVEGTEECDDGNSNDADGCSNACTKTGATGAGGSSGASMTTASGNNTNTCGDGKLDPGEQCDDGNDVDTDKCRNNCTPGSTNCGNGVVDAGEDCDDGNKVAEDDCTNVCTKPACGDGIVQMGEDCDDGMNNGEFGSKCPKDCKNPTVASSSSSGDPCVGQKTFAGVVSNSSNPSQMGSGVASKWAYNGLEGVPAGNAMCQAIGADHVCEYAEVVKAEAANELAGIPTNLTYWLHRKTSVPNPLLNKACSVDNDCTGSAPLSGSGTLSVLPYCDPKTKVCSLKPGAGGRCNDWTYPTGHISDGEWLAPTANPAANANTGVTKGTVVYHYDGDTFYDGVATNHLCKSNQLGCSGACAGATRAILCCYPTCN